MFNIITGKRSISFKIELGISVNKFVIRLWEKNEQDFVYMKAYQKKCFEDVIKQYPRGSFSIKRIL